MIGLIYIETILMRIRVHIENRKIQARSFIFLTISFAVIAVFFVAYPFLTAPGEKNLPEYAPSYSASPRSCGFDGQGGAVIKFRFYGSKPATHLAPTYTIKELSNQGLTIITFHGVTESSGDFSYNDITTNHLIDSLDYSLSGNDLVVSINRKNAYLPAGVSVHGAFASITLPAGDKYFPKIYNRLPADNSAVFPAPQTISFAADLAAPLKLASVMLENQLEQFVIIKNSATSYSFSFDTTIENNKEYTVKAIIADDDGRTTVNSWMFVGQVPSQTALGKDRFKYLGWWGEINADNVAVRTNSSSTAEKIGTLSSSNRVKVLKEVYGEWIAGKNLWYQIDGGMYPGAYIFSDYVTPMAQPKPPAQFSIPGGVAPGEKWIDVDLTKKVLTLFDYNKPVFATYISPGRAENPTQTGTYRVWYKLDKARMKGGPPLHKYRYDLKNIPWTMFYNYDYAIHGTYWHDKFGAAQSAGCTNMTQGDAKFIFDNTLPVIPEDKKSAVARSDNGKGTGTVVYNHE